MARFAYKQMKNLPSRAGLLLATATFVVSACSDGGTEPPPPPPTISVSPATQTIRVGESYKLLLAFSDPAGQLSSADVGWSTLEPAVASVTQEGVVSGLQPGTAEIVAAAGGVADTATVTVEVGQVIAPPPECSGEPIRLARGEFLEYPGGNQLSLCLSGGAEYVLVAANPAGSSAETLFRGYGTTDPATPTATTRTRPAPTPALAEMFRAGPPLDRAFETQLRQWERENLSPRLARSLVSRRALQVSPEPDAVGDLLELNTSASCTDIQTSVGRVEYIGEHAMVVADTANPDGFSPDAYARFGALFDTLLYPVVTDAFGEPAGLEGQSHIVIYYTRAVNELTPSDSDGVVGGYFWSADLFPKTSCLASNEREMFYILAPDPDGEINENERTVEYVERVTASTIAHELQHLINASRRLYVNDALVWEDSWLNEGLSHIAEELVYYDQSGNQPGQNIDISRLRSSQQQVDAANLFALGNILRLDNYLQSTEIEGPFQEDDDLATRGAAWQFLRYALDRQGGDDHTLLSQLVNSRTSGLENLEQVMGINAGAWFVDDAVALFADDYVPGLTEPHRFPSWDFRSILDYLNDDGFVINTRALTDRTSEEVRLEGWGAAYLRAAVRTGQTGQLVVGTEAAPPRDNLRFVLMRTR